jgi:uncharacterized protein YacL
MLLWIIRAFYFLTLYGTAAKLTQQLVGKVNLTEAGWNEWILFVSILIVGSSPVLLDVIFPRKRIREIAGIYAGLLIGSLLAYACSLALKPTLDLFLDSGAQACLLLVMAIVLCYVCVSILLQTKDDFRFIIPYVEFAREMKGRRPLLLDTSVIIDGRIADIAETGLLDQTLVVPQFVLHELQAIADSTDKLRRNRGRRGLDVIDRLQKCRQIELQMPDAELSSHRREEVDAKLLGLAKDLNGKLVTNDFNLAKTAKIQGIDTININEVSLAAKPPVLHGEQLTVRLVKEGEEPGQGIGYLDDGTMVVAELGKNFVGHEVNLIVTSILQTNAGRMIFGRIDSRQPEPVRSGAGRGP